MAKSYIRRKNSRTGIRGHVPRPRIDDDRNATGAFDFDCTADDVGVEGPPWHKFKVKTGSYLSPLFVGHLGLGYY